MKPHIVRAIAGSVGVPGEVQWSRDREGRLLVRAEPWSWEIERLPSLPAVSSAFQGELYAASLDVFTSGGAGLRSRYFAVTDARVLDLQDVEDMRWFLERYISVEDPVKLANLLEQCQGRGRMANVYQENERLERGLDARSRAAVKDLRLMDPIMMDGELDFHAWRIVMAGNEEVIELDHWTLSLKGEKGPAWCCTPLPGRLRYG